MELFRHRSSQKSDLCLEVVVKNIGHGKEHMNEGGTCPVSCHAGAISLGI